MTNTPRPSFLLSPQLDALRARVRAFVEAFVIPNEGAILAEDQRGVRTTLLRLQAEAKTEGLWTPHLPEAYGGLGLGVMGMCALFREMGRSFFGAKVFNCDAPDQGNMDLLIKAGSEAIKAQYGAGSLTVRTLRAAVAKALGVEEAVVKKVVRATLMAQIAAASAPAPASDDADDDWLPRLSREPDDDAFLQRLGEASLAEFVRSATAPRTLDDAELRDGARKAASTTLADRKVQKSAGDALWNAYKYSIGLGPRRVATPSSDPAPPTRRRRRQEASQKPADPPAAAAAPPAESGPPAAASGCPRCVCDVRRRRVSAPFDIKSLAASRCQEVACSRRPAPRRDAS